MDNLGIEKQDLDEYDQNYIEPHEADEENKPLSSDTPANKPDYINELERIAQLRGKALITHEDFEMKKKLLGLQAPTQVRGILMVKGGDQTGFLQTHLSCCLTAHPVLGG